MSTKPQTKLILTSRRVIVDDFDVPLQSLVVEAAPAATVKRKPAVFGVTLIAAQPFARPARSKQQRSKVLARRALTK